MAGMAGMAGQFMSSCESKFFRDRIVARIAEVKDEFDPDPNSDDQVEQFIAQNTPEQLEELIFQNSMGSREKYLSLTAEILLKAKQCRGKPGQGRENMNGAGNDMPNGEAANGDHTAEQHTAS